MRQQELPSKSSRVSIRRELRIVSGVSQISCIFGLSCSILPSRLKEHLQDLGCPWSTNPRVQTNTCDDTLKMTVGCPPCTRPSIRLLTELKLSRTRSCPSIHTKTCTSVGLLGPRGKNGGELKHITIRHKTLCKALRRHHLVSTLF